MSFLGDFIKYLFPTYHILKEYENDNIFEADIESNSFVPNSLDLIEDSLSFLQSNDKLVCTVNFGNADPISYYSDKTELSEYINRLKDEFLHQEEEPITIKITIIKLIIDGQCNIYDLGIFTKTLKSLNVSQFFAVFTRAFSSNNFIVFSVYGLDVPFNTSNIYFTTVKNSYLLKVLEPRATHIENFQSLCHYSNSEYHRLSPVDFKFNESSNIQKEIYEIFTYYSVILSIIYLFDITTLHDNKLEYKINGYKTINGSVNLSDIRIEPTKEYFDIFKWVYTGGNLNDKLGLARNIVSLHFAKIGELDLQGYPFQSIQSSYKIYEKQNINRYIEIRNKISDQLLDFNNRANKIVDSFAVGFQKSALALISFYISAIVIRVLSKGEFVNIFSLDTAVLSIAFIFGSFVYYLVSLWEIKEQRKRFVNSYNNLKLRYTDLLEENDIKRILNQDKEFNEDIIFIDSKRKIYSIMWLCFLLLLFISTLFLFMTFTFSHLSESLLFKLLF
jgi:succinate-acetate transporter protein